MTAQDDGAPEPRLGMLLRRVIGLTFVVSFVEVTTYMDVGGVYPGIMTGNTVQLGRSVALHHWPNAALIGSAIGLFFLGCIGASLIKRFLSWAGWELVIMAAVLVLVSVVRLWPDLHHAVELPLVALALGMQGETIAKFGGVSLQTIVVTNNMVKFSDAFVGRYLAVWLDRARFGGKKPALKEMALPACSWLAYALSAMIGALVQQVWRFGLLLPAAVLMLVVYDLRAERNGPAAEYEALPRK